jgi:signal transduction histidine kinase/ligand-binding sensor domain-containing protein/DNA-binding response OmpR family regulator
MVSLTAPINYRRRYLFSSLFFLLTTLLFAQDNDNEYSFTHYLPVDGLPFSTVHDMVQDSRDFMWFGTATGLYQYDGYSFKSFQNIPFDSTSLVSNNIYRLFELSNGNLLIGTYSEGISIYNPERETFKNYGDGNNNLLIDPKNIRAVYQDSKKRIWIGTEKEGLLLLNQEDDTFEKFPNISKLLSGRISAITEDKKGRLWLCDTYGITQFLPEKDTVIHFSANCVSQWDNVSGWDKRLFVDSYGEIWITTHQSGVYKFNPDSTTFVHFKNNPSNPRSLSHNNVACITEDKNKTIWIGTDGGGLNLFNRTANNFSRIKANNNIPASLQNNSVYSLFADKNGIVWVGTYRTGLSMYNPAKPKFTAYAHEKGNNASLSANQVLSIYEDSENNIWIGTDGGGLNLFYPERGSFKATKANTFYKDSLQNNVIKTIFEPEPGILWLGTHQGGLQIFDTKLNQFELILADVNDPGKMSSNNIWSISSTHEGNLWLAMLGKPIDFYDKVKQEFIKYPQFSKGISQHTTIVSYVDSKNRAWFCSSDGLLNYVAEKDTFITYNELNGLSSKDVISIFEDSQNRLWVGTNGGGLNYFNIEKKEFKYYTIQDGLPSNNITGILEDDNGNLWLSTTHGISRFNISEESFKNYDKFDGLPDNEFVFDCALKAKSGKMYFGSINGFVEFHPDSILDDTIVPPIYISDLLLFNKSVKSGDESGILEKSIHFQDEIVLKHNQSVLTFVYSAVSFINQEKIEYAYRLLGFEENWNFIGNKHEVTYTNLSPGNYTFQVKAANSNGVWNIIPAAELKLKVLLPLWRKWYMYVSYALFIAGILYYLRREILIRERFKGQIRVEKIKAEKIEEINQLKFRLFTEISHEFRTPLTLIIDPLDNLLEMKTISKTKLETLLPIVHQNAKRLLRLVNQLIDFRKIDQGKLEFNPTHENIVRFTKKVAQSFSIAAKERKINFSLQANVDEIMVDFDKDKLDKILFNLLSNAFRYTPNEGVIKLSIEQINISDKQTTSLNEVIKPNTYLSISVQDSGSGIQHKDLPTIFERFNQISSNESFNIKGTGIGLSLVKEYVNLHNGYVYVESEENKGAKFIVLLPDNDKSYNRKKIDINLSIPEETKTEDIQNLELVKDDFDNFPVVLIVEDNNELRDYLKSELSIHYKIIVAENGQEGYDMAVNHVPDIIISDIMMPTIDGIEMCKRIKFDEKTSHIPIILLTAKTADKTKIEGFCGGADLYLIKPFKVKVVLASINNILLQRKRLREKYEQKFISDSTVPTNNEFDDRFAKKMNEIIENNISNFEFNSDQLASELAVSRTGLYRKIKALTGQSASIYIRNIRLKKAASLLKEKKLPVTEVAYLTGFSQLSYFTKCFKELYTKSPSDFMNK